jgi:competence protein ComEA
MENPNWRQVLASILGISVLGLVGYLGGARTKSTLPAEQPPKFQKLAEAPASPVTGPSAEPAEEKRIVLDIGGAVAKPGVYWLLQGARLDDLVLLAGGLLPAADRERVNMAQLLRDGSKVTIPYRPLDSNGPNMTPPPLSEQGTPEPAPEDPPVTPEPRILNLNEATAVELQQLPAIGQELAGRIVKYREGVGGFRRLDELKQVRGIGDKLYEKIRAYLTL